MSKSRVDGDSAAVSEVVAVPELKAAPVALPVAVGSVESIGPARVFRDKVFTSRTLIMPSGIQLPVVASRVTACGDDQYAFLKAHPELEQLQE